MLKETLKMDSENFKSGSSAASVRKTSLSALPNYPNPDHLSHAVRKGDLETVQTLIAAGADPSKRDSAGATAIHHAAELGLDNIVELLAKNGAPLDVCDGQGHRPIDIAVNNGRTTTEECLIRLGSTEPSSSKRKRISDEASFLAFVPTPINVNLQLRAYLQQQSGFLLNSAQLRFRWAVLPFYSNVHLVAAEDSNRKGRREQFALFHTSGDIAMLDWTNEPIYSANERWGIDLSINEIALLYCRFFFFFVRGKLGRFAFVESLDQICWSGAAPEDVRQFLSEKLIPLSVMERPTASHIVLKGSVIFRDALFHTDIVLATEPTNIIDKEGNEEIFQIGQMRLTNEELIREDLPIEVEGPPGVFG